ncbi:MAG: hypothetical protein AB1393_03695 [Candidatus Edwardsbacteria bacterium]
MALLLGGLVYAGGVVACPLIEVSPPTEPEKAGYVEMPTAIAAAENMITTLKTGLEQGYAEFVDESYRTPFINKLEAVLNMLETGNTNGALMKIRHDLQDKELKWVAESSRLTVCYFLEAAAYMLENPARTYHIRPLPPGAIARTIEFGCEVYDGHWHCWIKITFW